MIFHAHLPNNLKKGLLTFFISFFTSAIFFGGCNDKSDGVGFVYPVSSSNEAKFFSILGPIADANVSIIDLQTLSTVYTTKTEGIETDVSKLVWGEYSVGSFEVDMTKLDRSENWIYLEVTSGVDVDSDDDGVVTDSFKKLSGKMKIYCKYDDMFKSEIMVANIFTTLGVNMYLFSERNESVEKFLTEFAQKIFIKSVDGYAGIDYRDLYAYIPNYTKNTYLKSAKLYENLLKYGVMDAVLENLDVIALLNLDEDGDGLNLWEEILNSTSPYLIDTDGDTIDDKTEVQMGLNPTSKDSDFDTIDDNDEQKYNTSPIMSDTDSDFIPDNIEIENGTDPLEADENANGVEDGLDNDPFFKYQWYLKSKGLVVANTAGVATVLGNDLNIFDVYHKVLGNNQGYETIIQVVDSGVELKHEDLNVDLNNSFNVVTKEQDPTPTNSVSKSDPVSPLMIGHGSAVAGIIAARTNNGIGIRGVVPRAKIAGSNWLEDQSIDELERVWYSQINDNRITVSNNSWGSYYFRDKLIEEILHISTSKLRYGKGRVFVFAAGNSREKYGNANLSYLTNNPYVITVAALNHEDKVTTYSNPGSCILVSGYGGEHYYTSPTIMTTSLSGESYFESELDSRVGTITVNEDTSKSYTYAMNGTSSATPMVSGAIALVLDACPELSWRDVRWLISHTSKVVDESNESWKRNGAGLFFSIDYGYGKVDASAMIDMCRSDYFEYLPKMKSKEVELNGLDVLIPDNNSSVVKSIYFDENMKIEWVGLTLDISHPFSGDLEIHLTSPMGTKVNIVKPNNVNFAGYEGGFRFGSVAYIDEESKGMWSIEIIDRLKNDEGSLKGVSLEIHGY